MVLVVVVVAAVVAAAVVVVVVAVHRRHRLLGVSVGNAWSETDHRRETRQNPKKFLEIPP